MADWSKYKNITGDTINQDIDSLGGNDVEVPDGEYLVSIERMEVKPTKTSGDPMLAVWFKIVDSKSSNEFVNKMIFMNHVLLKGDKNDSYRIKIANEFLRGLKIFEDEEIKFKNMEDYENLIDDIARDAIGQQYTIEYTHDKKGFAKFTIV